MRVSATISGHDGIAMNHVSNFQMTIGAKEYAEPGAYFILASQDLSQVKNPYIYGPNVTQDFGWE